MSEFNAPRDNLVRANFEQRADLSADGRTMVGYPIVFDTWTEINSHEGRFKERVAPGSVSQALKVGRDQIKILFNHGMDPQIGDKPLGKASVMEADRRGVYLEVPLSDTSYNDDIIALLRDGALDGMSFRFSVQDEEWEYPKKGLPERTITQMRLYEMGPVTFPAYQATSVGIRSREDFASWVGLTDEKRAAVAQIMGVEIRTSSDGAAEGTSPAGAAQQHNDSEQLGAHSGVTIIRRRVLDAADLLRSKIQ